MPGQPGQLAPDFVGRHDEIHAAGGHRIDRHGGIFRGFVVLGKGDTAGRFDREQPLRAIRAAAGKNDADCTVTLFLGQRAQEMVDGRVNLLRVLARGQLELALENSHHFVGRDHVQAVGLKRHVVFRLAHGHGRQAGQQRCQRAFVRRIEVLYQHEGHARLARQRF